MKYTRLQVPVAQETVSALRAYAAATDSTLPRVTAGFLDQIAPHVLELAHAIELAKDSPSRALRESVEKLQTMAADADQLAMDLSPKATGKKKTG